MRIGTANLLGSAAAVTPGAGAADGHVATKKYVDDEIAKIANILTPEQYGATGDGITDDKAAFQSLAAAIRAAGGGVVVMQPVTYHIDCTSDLTTLMDLTDCNGVQVFGNGATLHFDRAWAASDTQLVFRLDDTLNASFENLNFSMTKQPIAETFARGIYGFACYDACENLTFRNIRQTGGVSMVWCFRDGASQPATTKIRNVLAENVWCDRVGYPLVFAHSGDRVTVRGAYSKEAYRPFFLYGVEQHDLQIWAEKQFSQALLAAYNNPTTGYTDAPYCRNVRLNYNLADDDYTSTSFMMVCKGVGPVEFSNIDISLHVEGGDGPIFEIAKQDDADAVDMTGSRGHVFENIRLGATVKDHQSGSNVFSLWYTDALYGEWAGELVHNFVAENIIVSGTNAASCALRMTTGQHRQGPTFRNIIFPGTATIGGGFTDFAVYENVQFGSTYYGYFQDGNRNRTNHRRMTAGGIMQDVWETANGGANFGAFLEGRDSGNVLGQLRWVADGRLWFTMGASAVDALRLDATRVESMLPHRLASYTVGTLPAAATHSGSIAWCTDWPGGATLVVSNGTAWKSVRQESFSASTTNGAGTATSITASAWVKVPLDVEDLDTGGWYDPSTYRFQPTVAGYYHIAVTGAPNASAIGGVGIYKNGAGIAYGTDGSAGTFYKACSAVVYLNGSSDYVEMWAYSDAGGGQIYGARMSGHSV